ncbi:hypothetical protein QTP88_012958 [Uroleucon formosanum]
MASPNIGLLKVSPMCSACVYYIIVYTNDDGDGDGETTTTAVAAVVEDCLWTGSAVGFGQAEKKNKRWKTLSGGGNALALQYTGYYKLIRYTYIVLFLTCNDGIFYTQQFVAHNLSIIVAYLRTEVNEK